MLEQRAILLRKIRQFFDRRDFIEVETPLLSHDSVVDRHLHPIPLDRSTVTGCSADRGETMWLQTSPEFAMKRLLAAGATAIYQLGKAFRQAESGTQHNPEFTMLEWYRAGDDLQAGMDLLDQFSQTILGLPPAQRMTYQDALVTWAGIDPFTATLDELARACDPADPDNCTGDRDERLNQILSRHVEPQLGIVRPVLLYHYPASQSALARVVPDGTGQEVAERFELYVGGVELANGYHELTDAPELARRNRSVNQQRIQDGNEPLPESSRLLQAMRIGMPAAAGTALGVDRLLMVMTQSHSIDQVLPFPIDRA